MPSLAESLRALLAKQATPSPVAQPVAPANALSAEQLGELRRRMSVDPRFTGVQWQTPPTLPNLQNRPILVQPDGWEWNTLLTTTGQDKTGAYKAIPTVIPDGKGGYMRDNSPDFEKSWQHAQTTGEHLGTYATPQDAQLAAQFFHFEGAARDQGRANVAREQYRAKNGISNTPPMDTPRPQQQPRPLGQMLSEAANNYYKRNLR